MRTFFAGLAAGLAWLAPAAHAQDQQQTAQDPALWCVYEALTASLDYEVVAEAYLFDGDLAGDPEGLLSSAGKACAQTHDLNEAEQLATMEYGRFGSIIDYLTEELMFEGVTEDQISVIFMATDSISDEDYESLYEDGWQATDVGERVKAELLRAQFPDDPGHVETAMEIMGLIVLADEAELVYVLAGEDADGN